MAWKAILDQYTDQFRSWNAAGKTSGEFHGYEFRRVGDRFETGLLDDLPEVLVAYARVENLDRHRERPAPPAPSHAGGGSSGDGAPSGGGTGDGGAPGHGASPGRSGNAPGHSGKLPPESQGKGTPGKPEDSGKSGGAPGHAGSPGKSGEAHGKSGDAPGRVKKEDK